jgi:hypothetical protein
MTSHRSTRIVKPLLVVNLALGFGLWFSPAMAGGAGLPADFPLPPGLSPCNPIVMDGKNKEGRQIDCEWHNVDQHAVYTFYLAALPKAGYTLLPGAQEVDQPSFHMAAIYFEKGKYKGAMIINGAKDLTVQLYQAP